METTLDWLEAVAKAAGKTAFTNEFDRCEKKKLFSALAAPSLGKKISQFCLHEHQLIFRQGE